MNFSSIQMPNWQVFNKELLEAGAQPKIQAALATGISAIALGYFSGVMSAFGCVTGGVIVSCFWHREVMLIKGDLTKLSQTSANKESPSHFKELDEEEKWVLWDKARQEAHEATVKAGISVDRALKLVDEAVVA